MTYTTAQYAVGEASEKAARDGSPETSEGQKDVGSFWWGHKRSERSDLLALVCLALPLSPYSLLVVEAVGFWDTPAGLLLGGIATDGVRGLLCMTILCRYSESYNAARFSPEESAKAWARLGPQFSSVCVGVDKDTDWGG